MDKRARVVGMAVFALGVVVLLFVFGVAYTMFTSPADELLSPRGGQSPSLTGAGLGNALAAALVRLVLLFVMTLAGSLIASKGIQLYLGSGERPEKPGAPREAAPGGSKTRRTKSSQRQPDESA
ncbi:MAG TPA: hypothetical protein VMX94_01695 [Armatimonadota bacterium]|nr:hypothetical protein [Armatimonadota bacterium]